MGFAPQIAMALFAGSMVKNHKYAFAFPLLSMFLSDLLYEMLFLNGFTQIQGFYSGQMTNYLMICSLSLIGFYINSKKLSNIIAGSIAAPTVYFLASNFLVWIGGGGVEDAVFFYAGACDGCQGSVIGHRFDLTAGGVTEFDPHDGASRSFVERCGVFGHVKRSSRQITRFVGYKHKQTAISAVVATQQGLVVREHAYQFARIAPLVEVLLDRASAIGFDRYFRQVAVVVGAGRSGVDAGVGDEGVEQR
jgi:hypothetical protein